MKSINNIKTVSLTMGSLLVLSIASGSVFAAGTNPFGMADINHTYQVASKEGKCGEGKCGASKTNTTEKSVEGKCGASKPKSTEGKCGDGKTKAMPSESKCGGNK